MANGVRDLKVWQEATQLAGEVLRVMRQSTRRETKTFTDQTIESAAAIAAAISEGYVLASPPDHRRALTDARRQLATLEARLTIARHGGLISAQTHAQLASRLALVARLLSGYLGFIERQVRPDSAVSPEIADAVSAVVGLAAE